MRMAIGLAMSAVMIAGVLSACTSATNVAASADTSAKACIDPREISKQTIVSDQEIRFELRNGDTWVNKLPRTCPGLRIEGGFSWDVRGTTVCSNQERITVLNSGTPCMLGEFSKVETPA